MAKLRTWIRAARPRTVLLSFSGVLLGGFLAARLAINGEFFYPFPILFAAITAVLLQILSNLANDYGDFKKGTDSAKRVGPQREMQSGAITEKEMKWALVIVSGLCLFFCVLRCPSCYSASLSLFVCAVVLYCPWHRGYFGSPVLHLGQTSIRLSWTRRPVLLPLLRLGSRGRHLLFGHKIT